jgi:hypothetical protein
MANTTPQAPPLRILCFGDSLTAGYSKFGLIMAPYSRVLKTELDVKLWAWKGRRKVDVATDGQSGDLVTVGVFRERMDAKCLCCGLVVFLLEWRTSGVGSSDL